MIPNPILRFEILNQFGLKLDGLRPVTDILAAAFRATAAGQSEQFNDVLFPDELAVVHQYKASTSRSLPWRYLPGLSEHEYALATHTYIEPPPKVKVPHVFHLPFKVNPLRIRGGSLLRVPDPPACKAPIFLLTAPRIAGLLTGGAL